MAGARRRGNLDDPALGRQRHDRAVGRHPAGPHDARRCRASARGRRSGAGTAPAESSFWIPTALLAARRCACAAGRDGSCDGRPQGSRRAGLASVPSRRSIVRRHSLHSSRPSREPGREAARTRAAAQALVDEAGFGGYSRAPSSTWRRHGSPSTRRGTRMPARRLRAPTACGRMLDHGVPWLTIAGRARADARTSRTRRRRRRPHGSRRDRGGARAPPGMGCWSTTRGSCATASRRRPGLREPGR